MGLLLGSLLVWTSPAEAAAALAVDKSMPDQILAGAPASITLTVSNPGDENEYNLSLRDELPPGLGYVPGSTQPASFGEPTVVTAQDGHQTLVWENIVDLPPSAEETLTFQVVPDPDVFPVGSTITNTASGYAQTDPRTLPKFTADGRYSRDASQTADSNVANTRVTALRITKSEPSPEHELVRGVHDNSTVYSLRVENTQVAATNDVVVTDLLPAGLEFLGCGTADNSTGTEYPAAARLDAVPDVSGCVVASAVQTVVDPPGHPAGVYTQVTWELGTLAAGATEVIEYRAGIPQRENVPFTGQAPSPGSLEQAANLDNNTGPSTRETGAEPALTNFASAAGHYTGPVAPGADRAVSDSTELTVTAEDLALHKTIDAPASFAAGDIITYRLTVRTGEYASASDIVVTDVLPDGMCPLSAGANHDPDGNPECGPDPGRDPSGAGYADVEKSPEGIFTITFTPLGLPHNGTTDIVFHAKMMTDYTGHQSPTVSGDSFTNNAALTGTTSIRGDVDAPNPTADQQVQDVTSATISSDAPALRKFIQPDTGAVPYTCSTDPAAHRDDLAPDHESVTFAEGDRVCFLVRAEFSGVNKTRNVVITDFLPPGMTLEANSVQPTGNHTVTAVRPDPDDLVWNLGELQDGDRYVSAGQVFEMVFAATVTGPPPGPAPDLTANLAKMRFENTEGRVHALRDDVDLSLAAPPPARVDKSAQRITTPPGDLADGAPTAGEDQVRYTVRVTNNGSATTGNPETIIGPEVWDVLPVGLRCADVTSISPGGECRDPGASGYPTPRAGLEQQSVIRWDLPTSVTIAPGAFLELSYQVTLPDSLSVDAALTNTAAVSGYDTRSNTDTLIPHHPRDNISVAVPEADQDTPPAEDTHTLRMTPVTVSKSVVTDIAEAGNDGGGQATIGEGLTYTYSVRVPAHSSVYDGRLIDILPTGVTGLGGATCTFRPSPAAAPGALPTGFACDQVAGTLNFPDSHTNDTGEDQVFTVSLPARVNTVTSNTHDRLRTNTARFTSNLGVDGSAVQRREATAGVRVKVPQPTLAKDSDLAQVRANDTVTFTLRAGNTAGRPPLHDAFVVDCVPAGLTVVSGSISDGGQIRAGDGCAADATRLEWGLGTLAPGAQVTRTYQATVPAGAGGGARYRNTAQLHGSTLNDGKSTAADPDNPLERALTADANRTVIVPNAAVASKEAAADTYTIGERSTWTITTQVPARVNHYDATVVDQLPAGLDADTLDTVSVTCAYTDGAGEECALPAGAGGLLEPSPSASGSTVGWLLGDVLADDRPRAVTIVYTATVADLDGNRAGTELVNGATLRWNTNAGGTPPTAVTEDWDSETDPPATDRITVTEPRTSTHKGVDIPTPDVGQAFTYTVTATNAGTAHVSTAYQVTVVDTVPAGVVVDQDTISHGGTLTGAHPVRGGGTLTWDAGSLAPDASFTATYQAVLSSPPPDVGVTNTAEVTRYTSLPSGGREYEGDQARATVTPALPHVEVAKTVADPVAYVGRPTTWQLTLTNTGDATAHGVDATDVLPQNWAYTDTVSVTVNGVAVDHDPTVEGRTVTWTDIGQLAPGQVAVITFRATPRQAATTTPGVGGDVPHVNTATPGAEDALGNGHDGRYAGPADEAEATIHLADLVLTKEQAAGSLTVAGAPARWTIEVTNAGPDPAAGPWTVRDTLPAGLTEVSVTGTGWTCVTDTAIACTLPASAGPLPVGGSLPTLTVQGRIPADLAEGTELTNVATVTGSTYESDTDNNTDEDEIEVMTVADLRLAKELAGAQIVAGENATWNIAVTNTGPSVARGPITVTDTLPQGTGFVSAGAGSPWSCTVAGREVTCVLAEDLPVLAEAPELVVTASIPSSQTTGVVNVAQITSTTTSQGDNTADDDDTVTTPPTLRADLALAKTGQDVVAGGEGGYTFTVTNHGPSDATGVRVRDTLPAGVTYLGGPAASGPWTCSASGQDVTCDLAGSLVNGATAAATIQVRVAPDLTGAVQNTAVVTTDVEDPVPSNDEDGHDSTVTTEADLGLVKTTAAGEHVAGEQVGFTLTVTNHGLSDSPGPITVTDTLPEGMEPVSADGTGWACTPDGRQVVCVLADGLAVNASSAITLAARILPDVTASELTNRAVVDGPHDPNPGNDGSTSDVPVIQRADVAVTKAVTSGATSVVAGGQVEYTLTVRNAGPSDAAGVRIEDTIPAGTRVVAVSGSGWTCDQDQVVCLLDAPLAPGTDAQVGVVLAVDPSVPQGQTLTNTVVVATSTDGDDPQDNRSEVPVTVDTETDLAVEKTHTGAGAVAGRTTEFTVTVTNNGPSDAVGPVSLVDALPEGMTFQGVAATSTAAGWTCRPEDTDPRQVACGLPGAVPAGTQTAPLVIEVLVAADVDGELVNQVTLDGPDNDTDPTNHQDQAPVRPGRSANLSVTKTHQGTGVIGAPVDFSLQVSNAGPSVARGVRVTDTLPEGLEFSSAAGDGWECELVDGVITCTRADDVPVGEQVPPIAVTAVVTHEGYPSVTNTATVRSDADDPDPSDDTDRDQVDVEPLADLALTKTHDGHFVAGAQARYTLTVTNHGPTPVPGTVTVVDDLPAGLSFVAGTGDGWTCAADGRQVTCERADGLEVTSSTIDLVVGVGQEAVPSVTNTATVSSEATDPAPGNNTGTVTTEVSSNVPSGGTPSSPLPDVFLDRMTPAGDSPFSPAARTPGTGAADGSAGTAGPTRLAWTGSGAGALAAWAGLLIAVGAALTMRRRRAGGH